jgi:diadenylate cyclase
MSEESDAIILVVSEETGAISLAFDTKLYYDLSPIEAQRKLKEFLDQGIWGRVAEPVASASDTLDDGKDVFVEQ